MKKLLTFFLTALLAFAVGWAEPSTATYTVTAYNNGTLTGAPSGVSASISTNASQMLNGGSQLTSGKHFTLTLRGFTSSYKLTGISLNYCTNASSGTGTFTATLGSNQIGSYSITKVSSNGRTPRDADISISEIPFDGSDLVLNVTATANSVYVISFTIVYETGGSTVETCAAPQFSPDGGSSTTGSLDVTITSATEGATIYYTTDNTDPVVSRSSIANGGTVTLTESCTLKAMAVKSGMNNSAIITSQPYSITSSGGQPSLSTVYRKVTSVGDLVAGQKYIIVYENGNNSSAMGAFNGTIDSSTQSIFSAVTGLNVSNHRVDIAGTGVMVLTLDGTTDAWTLFTGEGYIRGGNSPQFTVLSSIHPDDQTARWKISADGVVKL